MRPLRFRTAGLLALLLAAAAVPLAAREAPVADPTQVTAAADVQWLRVVLAGRKVGHARIEREVTAHRIVTRQTMQFELGRAGVAMSLGTFESHEETPDGEPLAFTSVSSISGLAMRVEGRRLDDGRFALRSGAAGAMRDSVLDWPAGAVLSHGAERALRAAGHDAGTVVEISLFQPLLQDAVTVHHEIIGPTEIDLPEGRRRVIEARQTSRFPGGDMVGRVWSDADLRLRRMTMTVMGQTLELLDCDAACAQAPNQPSEILQTALVRSPAALAPAQRRGTLLVELHSTQPLVGWPGVDGQRLVALGADRYRVVLRHGDGGDAMPAPDARDLARTDWLDFDHPDVAALLDNDAGPGPPAQRMQRLQDRVHRHIGNKSLRVGYASAGDAARLREGDCTEHALLLAALGRAAGVHTRVVNGLAYSADFSSEGPVFVPHAWVAAWTGERWQAFDAALPGDDQVRLALHADDGDPWRFYSALDAFGGLRIERIMALPAAATAQ